MRRAWLIAVGLSLGLGVVRVDAQPRQRERRAEREERREERREQIKKKIRAMRAYTLTEELALDDVTAGRLFPLLARYDDETDKLVEKRVDLQRRLRHADARDNRAVERAIDEAVANQRAFWDLEARRIADLRKILAPVQVAKVLVVLPALERKIQNQLRRAIVRHAVKGDGGSRFDDDDDGDAGDDAMPMPAPAPAPAPRRP